MKRSKPRGKPTPKKGKLRARRSLSQNFLTDRDIACKIAEAVGPIIPPTDPWVFEIGSGKGFLTEFLLAAGWNVWGVEKDNRMIGMLKKKFTDKSRVRIHHADVLSLPENHFPAEPCPLVGNLPYGIGHAILEWLLREHKRFTQAIVMLQREVAARLTAQPGDSARSAVSLWFQSRARAAALFNIPPAAFHPPPRVTSTVLRLDFEPASPLPSIVAPEDFAYIVRVAFTNRRKTLANNLSALPGSDRAARERLWEQSGVDPSKRAQELSAGQFHDLAAAFRTLGLAPPVDAARVARGRSPRRD